MHDTAIPDMRAIVGKHDIVMITLDTLRFDAAQRCFGRGELPTLAAHLPAAGWERRHTPGSFTYAAHAAFFAGFLPTPACPGPHPRLFALDFEGSETIVPGTHVFHDRADIVGGFHDAGYRTICIGGVGFFNKRNALGSRLPALFDESHWRPGFGVASVDSTARQVACAIEQLASAGSQPCFLFINVSAIHQPNRHYLPGCAEDGFDSHCAALRYVDGELAALFSSLRARGPAFVLIFSDHGTAYGEDGFHGHRHAHDTVMTVPYAHFLLSP
ncbi:STM4013/SEN3800 family hydrolase [Luteibacter yeojuensis]|uniref:Metalloenzyme domain-containing protein n=1 Tax=Luteibacter yeojuensis TaxID=345309 RepID=A0A0F3KVS6_9GAMM|nr:STM4013/SEN3800 family hydrolase [Luteibacter yeojuensis]KJV35261.1 metalloenzyme domain-containing protein [Luteibacter yeojuensis]